MNANVNDTQTAMSQTGKSWADLDEEDDVLAAALGRGGFGAAWIRETAALMHEAAASGASLIDVPYPNYPNLLATAPFAPSSSIAPRLPPPREA